LQKKGNQNLWEDKLPVWINDHDKGVLSQMEIKNVAVIGAGAMGLGIAQVSAQAGYQVSLNDISEHGLEKALKAIAKSLDKSVERVSLRPSPGM
jgi:3-hydroxyacyl-CoA dehydrogenase